MIVIDTDIHYDLIFNESSFYEVFNILLYTYL